MSRSKVEEQQFLRGSLTALCFRPKESIIMNRGKKQSADSYRFNVPESFIVDKLQNVHVNVPLANTQVLHIDDVSKKTDLKFLKKLDTDETFSVYLPKHKRLANRLLYFLQEVKSPKQLIEYFVFLHDRCNPYLFNYVLSQVILNRHQELDFVMPDYFQMFPEMFINGGSYNKALMAVNIEPSDVRSPIVIEDRFTGNIGDPELLLNYFREDICLNLFHVIYNRIYPCDGPVTYVARPRRGEIFYFVCQQMIARYNLERFSNGLSRVKRLNNFNQPIPEACFSKLNAKTTKSNWPGRMKDRTFSDLDRFNDDLVCDVSALERWRDRFIDAIDHGHMLLADGKMHNIVNEKGIESLGQAIQSTITSPNQKFYGNFLAMGLIFLGLINDPVNKHSESYGVAADPTTTLRDAASYRWFALIVDILQSFKETLPKYTATDLDWPNVTIKSFSMSTQFTGSTVKTNEFFTQFGYEDVDLTCGLDYTPRETIMAKFRQLQPRPFTYRLVVRNQAARVNGTVRIFLLPKFDERQNELSFSEQRQLAVEMDKFTVSLNRGENIINRRSEDAMINQWFVHEVDYFKKVSKNPRPENMKVYGWPKNLLVPKGNSNGYPCQLFVMLTSDTCHGFSDDKKPLGFPFDRPTLDTLHFLSDFSADYDNMTTIDTKITFLNNSEVPK